MCPEQAQNSRRESGDERRIAIARAARALIIGKGLEGLRTRDIAERVGINIATLHYHVPSKEALVALCKKHGIVRLEVFGSAATGKFNPETSDLDFIIDLGHDPEMARRFIDFANDLEEFFGRRVDLMMYGPIKNPYLKLSVDRSRELIYAATDGEAAA